MKQLIETPEDLLKFLKKNWNNISDNTYNAILWESLQVYQIKPILIHLKKSFQIIL